MGMKDENSFASLETWPVWDMKVYNPLELEHIPSMRILLESLFYF